ncbi:MAG: hypothetical protein CM1200mP2_41520 [Planctomycetaceae bacterium]|nr:MAG: hypothetical protein CM1200mP2_41520 [Planctomycetaceae bacterium]
MLTGNLPTPVLQYPEYGRWSPASIPRPETCRPTWRSTKRSWDRVTWARSKCSDSRESPVTVFPTVSVVWALDDGLTVARYSRQKQIAR